MFEKYKSQYNNLLFEPNRIQKLNPQTGTVERYYSHLVSGDWFEYMHNWAMQYYAHMNHRVRLLVAHIYSDGSFAEDDSHHPIYMQLGNAQLSSFESMDAKDVIGFIPVVEPTSKVSAEKLARIRALLFQLALGKVTKVLGTAHLEVCSHLACVLLTFSRELLLQIP